MPALNHTHKYHKVPLGRTEVFACALPDCTHYWPAHLNDMMLGKKTICWECDKPFFLDEEAMKLDKPICAICRYPEIADMAAQLAKPDVT